MGKQIDLKKVLQQQLEVDEFFAGDFGLKGKPAPELVESIGDTQTGKSLIELADEINKCCKCDLTSTRTRAVPGEGNPDARIVFVGEAPGADEDAQGRPFVGRSGKLLTKIINAMGLERKDVFICNILKCRPPENRDPKPEEIVQCEPYLNAQLDLIRPEIIIALGAHAAKTLLQTNKPIGQLRGRFHDYYFSPDEDPVKLMPTYHPSYLLRSYSPDNRRRVWEDMQKVLAELGMEVPTPSKKAE
jgi:DNA polymerase